MRYIPLYVPLLTFNYPFISCSFTDFQFRIVSFFPLAGSQLPLWFDSLDGRMYCLCFSFACSLYFIFPLLWFPHYLVSLNVVARFHVYFFCFSVVLQFRRFTSLQLSFSSPNGVFVIDSLIILFPSDLSLCMSVTYWLSFCLFWTLSRIGFLLSYLSSYCRYYFRFCFCYFIGVLYPILLVTFFLRSFDLFIRVLLCCRYFSYFLSFYYNRCC